MMENPELKVSVSNRINGNLQYANIKSDSFALDMDRFDTVPNSRITRNQSRKGSHRGGEKKMNSSADNERDGDILNLVPNSSSPRAAFEGTSTHEKPILVTVGATTNHPINQQIHHQITITTPATAASVATTESKIWGKRYSFKRSSSSWTIDPRRILFFFATLSSMGTILLIYFTLSMGKLRGDDNVLN